MQLTNFFNLFGIKPNFSLAVLVAIAASGVALHEFLLPALLSAVILKFKPGFDVSALAFAITAFAAFAANRFLPWTRYINNTVLIVGATVFLNILLSPIRITPLEIVYNVILGTTVLMALSKNNEQEERFKF